MYDREVNNQKYIPSYPNDFYKRNEKINKSSHKQINDLLKQIEQLKNENKKEIEDLKKKYENEISYNNFMALLNENQKLKSDKTNLKMKIKI